MEVEKQVIIYEDQNLMTQFISLHIRAWHIHILYVCTAHLSVCTGEGRIQLPKSVRTIKKIEKIIPLSFTPPWDSMP